MFARDIVAEIRDIRNKVVEESSNISKAVDNGNKTDAIVKKVIENSNLAEKKVGLISSELAKSEGLLSKLQKQSDFESVISAAQSDDLRAFERLKIIAENPNESFHTRASAAWKSIRTQANAISAMKLSYSVNWSPNVDPNKIGVEALSQIEFQAETNPNASDFEFRSALIDYISGRQDFSTDRRLRFLLDVMRLTNSIKVFANAAFDFNHIAALKSDDLTSIDYYEQWWRSHPHEQN